MTRRLHPTQGGRVRRWAETRLIGARCACVWLCWQNMRKEIAVVAKAMAKFSKHRRSARTKEEEKEKEAEEVQKTHARELLLERRERIRGQDGNAAAARMSHRAYVSRRACGANYVQLLTCVWSRGRINRSRRGGRHRAHEESKGQEASEELDEQGVYRRHVGAHVLPLFVRRLAVTAACADPASAPWRVLASRADTRWTLSCAASSSPRSRPGRTVLKARGCSWTRAPSTWLSSPKAPTYAPPPPSYPDEAVPCHGGVRGANHRAAAAFRLYRCGTICVPRWRSLASRSF